MVLKLVAGRRHDSWVRCESSQEEGQDSTCTIFIHRNNSMEFLSGSTAVYPGTLIYDNIILMILHWEHQMMVQIWNMNGLVDNKVVIQACERVQIGEGTTEGAVLLCTKQGVIPLEIDRTIVII